MPWGAVQAIGELMGSRAGSVRTRLLLTAALAALGGCVSEVDSSHFLDMAVQAGNYLDSVEQAAGGSIPDRLGESTSSPTLGSGAAGRALFFAELYHASSDARFLELARRQAWAALDADSSVADNYSLYGGLAGIAFAAAEVGRTASDPSLIAAADQRLADIVAASPIRGGPGWGPVNDVIGGAAGTGLVLLSGHARSGDPGLLEAAIEIGDTLLARADSLSDRHLRWQRGVDTPFDLPNFSHGTAGVGLFLSRLGETAAAPRFSTAGQSAIRYLHSVADERDGLFLVPYGIPNEGYVTKYDIGWAHGPAGTARIHYADWILNETPMSAEVVDRSAQTILRSGVPGSTSDPTLWAGPFPIDRRFGMAGIVPFLVDVSRVFGEASYSRAALEIADHIIGQATTEAAGSYWRVPLYGFQGGEGEAVFTGYFYGTAGLGLALLEAHYAATGGGPAIRFPDDPFGQRRD